MEKSEQETTAAVQALESLRGQLDVAIAEAQTQMDSGGFDRIAGYTEGVKNGLTLAKLLTDSNIAMAKGDILGVVRGAQAMVKWAKEEAGRG